MADDDELDKLDNELTIMMALTTTTKLMVALMMMTMIPWTSDDQRDHDNLTMTTAHEGLEKVTTVPMDLMTTRPMVLTMTKALRKVLTMTTLVMETLIMTRGPILTLMRTGGLIPSLAETLTNLTAWPNYGEVTNLTN